MTKEHEIPAFLAETPVVIVDGREYRLRRLGVLDTFRLARILATGAARLGSELSRYELTPETVVMLLVAGVPYAEREALELLASILGVEPRELADPELFPMHALIDIGQALSEHPDLKAFFEKFTHLLSDPRLRAFTGRSTAS
jgi:hypothetical protein|uniref:Uncharacterized protein n=2 Tax=Thermorudis TaxID=1649508 RepID=A0A7C3A832_9BACT